MPIIQGILCRKEWPHQAETNKLQLKKKLSQLSTSFIALLHTRASVYASFSTHLDFHLQKNFVLKGSLNCFQLNLFSHLFSKHCAVAVQLDTLCTTSWQLWCAKTMPHPIITNPPQRSCDRASPGLAVPIPHAFELKQLKTDTRPFCYTWSNRPPVLQFPKHCVEIAQMDSNGRHVLFHLQTSFFIGERTRTVHAPSCRRVT